MKVTINLTLEEATHLLDCNSYLDACGTTIDIIDKIKVKLRKL